MKALRGTLVGVALCAGGLGAVPPLPARAEAAPAASLAVARLCVYEMRGGAVVVGGNAPIRCEPSAEAVRPASRAAFLASNPVGIVPQVAAPLPGYERVWEDGRVNPGRGVPRPVSGPALFGTPVVAEGSTAPP